MDKYTILGLLSTTSVKWSILCFFIDFSVLKSKRALSEAKKISETNKEYFIPLS